MKKRYTISEICIMAVFVSVGLVLQCVEASFAVLPIPGGKLGLANIVSILNLFLFGGGNAMMIAILRGFIGALVTGGAGAAVYSVAGAAASTAVMWLAMRGLYPRVSEIGTGVLGAVAHNTAQLCVACYATGSWYAAMYLPILLLISVVCGTVTGYTAGLLRDRMKMLHRRNL